MPEKEYNLKVLDCQEKSLLKLSWANWLCEHFGYADWFGTLTFHDFKSTYSAKRYFNKWLRIVNRKRFGNRARREDISVSWVLGEEKQERGALHYHLLMNNVTYLMRNEFGKAWWTITGGYGKILPSSGLSAIQYLTKYIVKDGSLDVDIRDNNTGQRLTLDVPGATKAEEGRQGVLTGFYLPSYAN